MSPSKIQNPFSLIVTERPALAGAIRQAMDRLGCRNAADQVVSLEQAAAVAVAGGPAIRWILVELADAARGLDAVRHLRSATSRPIFAVGPRDADLILEAIRSGASDYLEETDTLDEQLARGLSRHDPVHGFDRRDCRLICVTSACGGCGGSLMAVNLAAALTSRVPRPCLCDFDLQNGVCDSLLNLAPKHTILDLSRCWDDLDRNSVETALSLHDSGVRLLAAPPEPLEGKSLHGEFCERVVRTIQQIVPVVVVDLPRVTSEFDASPLLKACDKLVLVTRLDFNSVRCTRRTLDVLDKLAVPPKKIHIVWNRFGQSNELTASKSELALNRKIAHLLPDDPKTVNRSINCGRPFVLDAPRTKIAQAVETLAQSILNEDPRGPAATGGSPSVPSPHSRKLSATLRRLGISVLSWLS